MTLLSDFQLSSLETWTGLLNTWKSIWPYRRWPVNLISHGLTLHCCLAGAAERIISTGKSPGQLGLSVGSRLQLDKPIKYQPIQNLINP